MELTKRLRRIKDHVIYGYSDAMAQSLGMEIVMCDEEGNVVEVIGEVGSPGVHGRLYAGNRVSDEEAEKRLKTPAKKVRAPRKRASTKKPPVKEVSEEALGESDYPDFSD